MRVSSSRRCKAAPCIDQAHGADEGRAALVTHSPYAPFVRNYERVLGDVPGMVIAGSAAAALQGSDALAIVTEWKEFHTRDFEAIKAALRTLVVFDGRNLYAPAVLAALGREYHCTGRPPPLRARR